jgi:uncharacterized protein
MQLNLCRHIVLVIAVGATDLSRQVAQLVVVWLAIEFKMRYWVPFSSMGVHYLYSYYLGTFSIIDDVSFPALQDAYETKALLPHSSSPLISRLISAGAFNTVNHSLNGRIDRNHVFNSFLNCNHIVLETTNLCQLSCDYCTYGKFYKSSENYREDKLSIETVKYLIKYLYDNGTGGWQDKSSKLIVGFYGGEPLLRPEFIISIINYFNELKIQPHYAITTNGVLLKGYIELLVKNNFHILVSLDGDEKANTPRRMKNGKSSFHSVIESLNELKKSHPEYYKSNVAVNSVLTSYTDIEKTIEYFDNELELSNWNFNAMSQFGLVEKSIDEFNQLVYRGSIPENEVALKNIIKGLCWNVPTDYNSLFQDGFKFQNNLPTGTCIPFSKKTFLSSTGHLFACEKIGMNMPIGKVSDDSINIYSDDVAVNYNNIYNDYREYCVECQKYPVCTMCALQSDAIKNCPEYLNESNLQEWFSERITKLNNRKTVINHILDSARLA